MLGQQIAEGQYTRTVYQWITEGKLQEAIELLEFQLQVGKPKNEFPVLVESTRPLFVSALSKLHTLCR
jgi:hypothetical protein